MLKTKNCVTAIMLSVIVGVTAIPAGGKEVFAEENQKPIAYEASSEEDWDYEEQEDGTLAISQYTGTNAEVVIPSEIAGKKVTSIDSMAFQYRTNLTSVSIPEGVTSIGYQAFAGCSSLKSITLPEGLTAIGYGAFMFCRELSGIIIPESVANIGDVAFMGCSELAEIAVDGNNSDYASKEGLLYNKNMTELIVCPEGKNGEAEIPESVETIHDFAFEGCGKLTKIETSENNQNYISSDGILYNKDMTELAVCPAGKAGKVEIPEGVTIIGKRAFGYCNGVTEISIPKGMISIKDYAFEYCTGLTNVSIPEGVTNIGVYVFEGCKELESVTIPKSVTSIGQEVFFNCDSITLLVTAGSYAETYAKDNNIKYRYIGECVHNYTSQITIEPTCTAEGERTYTCTECGNSYPEAIPATGHTWKTTVTPATAKKNGSMIEKCIKCGEQKSETVIYLPKTIKLSKTTYTYNGKVQKPSVTIKDSKGKVLKEGTNYTLSYPKGMKNVGSYTVTIKFKGNYSGTLKKTFTITPKGTSLSRLTAKSKGFTVKWKKQTSQTTGYEVAYSTSSKFTKKTTKTITVSKNRTISKSVSKLKAKKKYYVRVRTYKTVKVNGKSTKICSNWSKVKNITTKK